MHYFFIALAFLLIPAGAIAQTLDSRKPFPLRAENTVLLVVENAEQLCQWQMRYGIAVIVPAQQITGSSAWRFRQQSQLPYGLTRLQLYHWGAPRKPYPLAYTRYESRNYLVLASFEHGYRLHYLPKNGPMAPKVLGTAGSNLQVSGTIIFWLEPAENIPENLPQINENFQSENYNFEKGCKTYKAPSSSYLLQ